MTALSVNSDSVSDSAIDLQQVAKVYRGRVHALQGIDMRVQRGEVFGLLGPNGAGKSTLVKIIMTVIRPTTARGTVLGRAIGEKSALSRVGYLPENHRFPRYLTGRQTLDFFAALSGMPRAARRRRANELLDTVGMSEWADRRVGTYSKGMMQRVGLAQALANDPDLVLLDEPTDGVDPVGRKEIRDVLAAIKSQGKTVFINSHMLSELEMVCDRVAILVGGRVARQGTLDELAFAKQRYEIDFIASAGPLNPQAMSSVLGATFDQPPAPGASVARGKLTDGSWIELDGTTIRVGTSDAHNVQPILDALRRSGVVIRRVQHVRPSLEDLFIDVLSDQGAAGRPGARLNSAGATVK